MRGKTIRLRRVTIASLIALVIIMAFPVISKADTINTKYPIRIDNLYPDLIRTNYIEATDNGYMRLINNKKVLYIEKYDKAFNHIGTKTLNLELPIWGGFYKGKDAYYLVEGRNNKNGIDGTEVVRIIKYDTNWNRLGSGSIRAQEGWEYEIRYPFDHSCVNMTETGGKLYVVTGREGYVDEQYGQGHQGMMLIRMDEESFQTEIVYGNFWHSFSQHIDSRDSDIFIYEQSEGSRATTLSRFDGNSTGTDYFDAFTESFPVFDYGGERTSAWSIPCYASADDVALSSNNVLGLGTSIDQSRYDKYDEEKTPYNIYLTVTPLSDLSTKATEVKWLTSYANTYKEFTGVAMTRINDDRFLITWEEMGTEKTPSDKNDSLSGHVLHYIFVDGAGNKVSKEYKVRAAFSDCHPTKVGDKVVFCASDIETLGFYCIDAETGDFSKRVHQTIDISNAKIKKIPKQTYTGKAIKPVPVVTYGGKKLIEGEDYTVSYGYSSTVGEKYIYVKGKGRFGGEVGTPFRIIPKGTSLSKVSPGKKSLTVKWKKQAKQLSGYQIQIATNKSFTKGKKLITVKGKNTASKKIKNLKAKKKYYVRVRTYKNIEEYYRENEDSPYYYIYYVKYCSAWSEAKAAKTKK